MQQIKIRATKEKETAATWRFEADDPNAAVKYVYLKKSAFAGGDVPKAITLTIATGD